jgi:flagellar motor switch protein FliM
MAHQETSGQEVLGKTLRQDRTFKVKTYDFKRPDKFSKEQIRTISIMNEVFARIGSIALSGYVRKEVRLRVAAVDQLTYEEFMQSVPNPSILGVIGMDPLPETAVLQMDAKLFSSMEDRLLGGAGEAASSDRDITEVELQVADRLLSLLLRPLKESWQQITEIEPDLKSIETNPHLCQIVPPTEMIVLVSIEVSIGTQQKDMINLAMPYIILEPVVSRLTPRFYYRAENRFGQRQPLVRIETRTLVTDMAIVAEGPELSLAELAELGVGDALPCPGLDKRQAWLRTGDQDVLQFCIEGDPAGKSVSLLVAAGSGLLGDPARAHDAAGLPGDTHVDDKLSNSVSGMAAELRKAVNELKGGFRELADRQDEIADQLFLSNGDSRTEAPPFGGAKPFDFISVDDVEILHGFVRREHPQLCALVLSFLDPKAASRLLGLFEAAEQIDLAGRIAVLDRTQLEILSDVEEALRRKFNLFDKGKTRRTGGLDSLTSILNLTSRSVEKTVIEGLEKSDADLAEEIKKRMFVFEDIVLLDDKAVAKVVGQARLADFAMAMRGVEQEVVERILDSCDETGRKTIVDLREEIGPVRLTDVEAAQNRIVEVIRKLEDLGEIIVARTDELIL